MPSSRRLLHVLWPGFMRVCGDSWHSLAGCKLWYRHDRAVCASAHCLPPPPPPRPRPICPAYTRAPLPEPILYLNGEEGGLVNNCCFPSTVQPSYAPPGQVGTVQPSYAPPGQIGTVQPSYAPPGQVGMVQPSDSSTSVNK